jgi:hypothetical protein
VFSSFSASISGVCPAVVEGIISVRSGISPGAIERIPCAIGAAMINIDTVSADMLLFSILFIVP